MRGAGRVRITDAGRVRWQLNAAEIISCSALGRALATSGNIPHVTNCMRHPTDVCGDNSSRM
jgi:hypothetical protein